MISLVSLLMTSDNR